jgi:hypothetical protein
MALKSALCWLLVTSLVTSLAACATASGPRQIDAGPGGGPPPWNWSRVGEIAPAAAIAVTTKGSPAGSRYFVRADEAGVTVLNLTDPALPGAATRVLRRMASQRPENFAAMQESRTFEEDTVRVGRSGVFVSDRKVADFERVVETLSRNDVTEISGPVVARGSVSGAILGGWLGFGVGVVPALGGATPGLAWLLLLGSVTAGAFLGSHWSSHLTEGVIYRAP